MSELDLINLRVEIISYCEQKNQNCTHARIDYANARIQRTKVLRFICKCSSDKGQIKDTFTHFLHLTTKKRKGTDSRGGTALDPVPGSGCTSSLRSFEGIYLEIMQIAFPTISIFNPSEQSALPACRSCCSKIQVAICSACLPRSARNSGCCGSASASVSVSVRVSARISACVGLAAGAEWKFTFSLPELAFPTFRSHPFRARYPRHTCACLRPRTQLYFLFSRIFLGCSIFHARENERA